LEDEHCQQRPETEPSSRSQLSPLAINRLRPWLSAPSKTETATSRIRRQPSPRPTVQSRATTPTHIPAGKARHFCDPQGEGGRWHPAADIVCSKGVSAGSCPDGPRPATAALPAKRPPDAGGTGMLTSDPR